MSSTAESFALHGVTIVDTRTGQLTPKRTIVMEGGKISRIVPAGSTAESPARTVDATGKFAVPGFLDMHAHIVDKGDAVDTAQRDDSLALMLAYGITGWRQMSGSPELLERRRQGKLILPPDAPEMLEMPGQILIPANAPTPEASVAEIRRQKAEGADFIKTISVSPKTFFASLKEARSLGLGYAGHLSLGVSAEKASKAGMTAIEHLGPLDMQLISCSTRGWLVRIILALKPPAMPDLSPEKMATVGRLIVANPTLFRLQMDPTGLAKSQRLVDSFSEAKCRNLARVCVAHGTWQVPTLIRIETMQFAEEPRFAEDPNLRFIPKATRQFWVSIARQFAGKVTPQGKKTLRQMMQLALKMTKIFDESGVKMLAGSDYGGMWVIPGVSLHQEFDLLEQAGLSPLRVLQMTTLDGAEFLHREATMGTVEEGKEANLVLLDRNPIESVQNLHTIHGVVRAGTFYSNDALEGLKRMVADHVESA
jgi:imidazolonepropionase-like amidohydrolase